MMRVAGVSGDARALVSLLLRRNEVTSEFAMDRRLSFPKSRIAKIMDLATSHMANIGSQDPIEAEIEQTEQNNNSTNEDGYGYHVRESIEGSLPEKPIESPVQQDTNEVNEHQNPITSENSTEMVTDIKKTNTTNVNTTLLLHYYYVTTMLMLAAKLSPQLQCIEHKFLVPGHTHMEADTDHALIERKKKHTSMDIHLPRDWYQLVRTASNKTSKFTVIEMTHDVFYDINIFSKQYLTLRKTANEKFLWCDVRSVLYTKENVSRFSYKQEFKNVEYMIMDWSKRGKAYDMITINTVPKAYQSNITISTEKKKDLLALLSFIHESAHELYRSLSCKNDVRDTPPDNDDDSDDE